MKIRVRAVPAPGHEVRRRAGRAWGKGFVTVDVVDELPACKQPGCKDGKVAGKPCGVCLGSGKAPEYITPAQYAELQGDLLIMAVPEGVEVDEVSTSKLAVAELQKELATERRKRADSDEQAEFHSGKAELSTKAEAASAVKIAALENEVAALKAQLGKKK